MNRDTLHDAILELADSPHMRQYVIEQAMTVIDLHDLHWLFDQVADHHEMLHPRARRRVPRNAQLDDRVIIDRPAMEAAVRDGLRLCVHADDDYTPAHWITAGEHCTRG